MSTRRQVMRYGMSPEKARRGARKLKMTERRMRAEEARAQKEDQIALEERQAQQYEDLDQGE